MILECEFCGTKWNSDTVRICPNCNIDTIKHHRGTTEATSFFEREVSSKKRITNSYRRNCATQYERKTGKQIGRS